MYEITKPNAVLQPAKNSGPGRPPKYPFGDMEIGDSFRAGPEDRACVQRAASMYGLRTGKVFPTRRQKDGGVVCWRVA